MAMRNHVMKARDMESSNLSHGRCDGPVQNFKSLAYKMATPADEHAAASDNVAVTCVQSAILESTEAQMKFKRELVVRLHQEDKFEKFMNLRGVWFKKFQWE